MLSEGGNESLFKLAENAAPPEDRIMPSQRVYAAKVGTVGLNEAIANMQKRKADHTQIIPGGLDDNTSRVRKSAGSTAAPDEEEMAPAPNAAKASKDPEEPVAKRGRKAKGVILDPILVKSVSALQYQLDSLTREIRETVAPKNNPKPRNSLETFMQGNHKVTFMVNGMEFTVRCLDMVKDESTHCMILAFPESGDSFFSPPVQSELEIRYDGVKEPGKLFYFGMNALMKPLGLRILGFLYDSVLTESKSE